LLLWVFGLHPTRLRIVASGSVMSVSRVSPPTVFPTDAFGTAAAAAAAAACFTGCLCFWKSSREVTEPAAAAAAAGAATVAGLAAVCGVTTNAHPAHLSTKHATLEGVRSRCLQPGQATTSPFLNARPAGTLASF
jgi:hypothetical protein